VLQLLKTVGNRGSAPTISGFGGQPEELFDKPDLNTEHQCRSPIELAPCGSCLSPRSPESFDGRCGIRENLLGIDPAFDCAMILFEDLIQVFDGR
jgi:hypothetical protein